MNLTYFNICKCFLLKCLQIVFYCILIQQVFTQSEISNRNNTNKPQNQLRKFCLGTDNGKTEISVGKNLTHYERLKLSYINCQQIIGNLEITHIDETEIRNSTIIKHKNGTTDQKELFLFKFLEHVEEITGYLLIFNVNVENISLPKLKIIWGEKTIYNSSFIIEFSSLRYLNLPSLRSIENGQITIRNSPNLCYLNPNKPKIDYKQFFDKNWESQISKLTIKNRFNCDTNNFLPCDKNCISGKCFGPNVDQCQTIYRDNCHGCESNSCYVDSKNISRCCDRACAGGCYGSNRNECIACKNFEEDGKCVNECRGIFSYKSSYLIKEELPDEEKRYYYRKNCVKKCPSGTLIEDKFCVARCSQGFYRNIDKNDISCIPCNGKCPKVCQFNERLNSVNIKKLANCSEIDGNLEIFSYVFTSHYHNLKPKLSKDTSLKFVPALTISDLEVLKNVKIVTGYVLIDGGYNDFLNSLNFLENLEMIEGRTLLYENYSLYITSNNNLLWIGLKSLKKIKNGLVRIQKNPHLCYGYSIPFTEVFGVNKSFWINNTKKEECEKFGRKCHVTCDAAFGCWGPGPDMCVRCKNFIRDGICSATCPLENYYVSKDLKTCNRCHPECLGCNGPKSTDCKSCYNYEFWTRSIDENNGIDNQKLNYMNTVSTSIIILNKKVKKCVNTCPNSTYVTDERLCLSCHEACYEFGCTGPTEIREFGGCNRCKYGIKNETSNKIKCLTGETEETVCKSNQIPKNYFVGFGLTNISKYMCQKCPSECRTCTQDSILIKNCECAKYQLLFDNKNNNLEPVCVNECGKGSYLFSNTSLINKEENNIKICMKCHKFCDNRFSCSGQKNTDCQKCALASIVHNKTITECLEECPRNSPFLYEGTCHNEDKNEIFKKRRNTIISAALSATLLFFVVIAYLIYRCTNYRKKYEKEAQMHLPDIPALDPRKVTQRPNMRRLILIGVDELDDSKNNVLGSGAFGIVYAGKWKPPSRPGISIPVAIKAINRTESRQATEAEMMKEAGLMASIQHEHLLPLVGICVAKGGIKIVTILRPLGSLLKFLKQHKTRLGSKNLIIYCYQISSAMEFLIKKKIVHRDLAARNVLVKNINHVEVTDFGLAQMLSGSETSITVEGRVAIKWLAIESLRQQIYTERTDVWSFGITCWEIITCGHSPYKELNLPKDHRQARELATKLEKGYRLKQPSNCSQELYQEMLNCWLIDPDSRPSFKKLKEKFEMFCKAPHIYIQERQATQRIDSITLCDQRQMIERLLQDSDFLDPVNIDPCEYTTQSSTTNNGDHSFSTNTVETILPPTSPCSTPTKPLINHEPSRHCSTITSASSRYKADPWLVKYNLLTSFDEPLSQNFSSKNSSDFEITDNEYYLIPRNNISQINNSKNTLKNCDELYLPTYLNEAEVNTVDQTNTYENDYLEKKLNVKQESNENLLIKKCGIKAIKPYVNVQQHETLI